MAQRGKADAGPEGGDVPSGGTLPEAVGRQRTSATTSGESVSDDASSLFIQMFG